MSFTFTPSTDAGADAGAIAAYQSRLAKLAPSCTRCGRKLTKTELAAGTCRDREVCRIRRAGGSVAGFATLRKYARANPDWSVLGRPAGTTAPAAQETPTDTRSTAAQNSATPNETPTPEPAPEPATEPAQAPTQALAPSTVKASTSEPSDAWSVEEEAPVASPPAAAVDVVPVAPVEAPAAPAAPAPARGYAVRYAVPLRVARGRATLRALRCD